MVPPDVFASAVIVLPDTVFTSDVAPAFSFIGKCITGVGSVA
jgi:hypothetical protein